MWPYELLRLDCTKLKVKETVFYNKCVHVNLKDCFNGAAAFEPDIDSFDLREIR